MEEAEAFLNAKDYRKSVLRARSAFESAKEIVEKKSFGETFGGFKGVNLTGVPTNIEQAMRELSDGILEVKSRISTMNLGIELDLVSRYTKISAETASTLWKFLKGRAGPYMPTEDEASFVFRFVFDALTKWRL